MNVQRAKEISTSSEKFQVTCHGIPVYIQHVDEKNETARIYPLDDPEKELDVAVSNLIEK